MRTHCASFCNAPFQLLLSAVRFSCGSCFASVVMKMDETFFLNQWDSFSFHSFLWCYKPLLALDISSCQIRTLLEEKQYTLSEAVLSIWHLPSISTWRNGFFELFKMSWTDVIFAKLLKAAVTFAKKILPTWPDRMNNLLQLATVLDFIAVCGVCFIHKVNSAVCRCVVWSGHRTENI